MKTPKKKQLYDVCEMLSIGESVKLIQWIATPHHQVPAPMARYYVRTLKRANKGSFYMFVKNGLNPLVVLQQRKTKKQKS